MASYQIFAIAAATGIVGFFAGCFITIKVLTD